MNAIASRLLAVTTLLSCLLVFDAAAQTPEQMQLLSPADFASEWHGAQPPATIIYVGFPVLYKGAHIRDAILAGPASKPEGIEALTQALAKFGSDEHIVLYCGCCPFDKCPNIRPAYKLARERGFRRVEVLRINTNLHTDWVQPGYPTEKP